MTVRRLGFADTLVGVALPEVIGMLNILLMRTASWRPHRTWTRPPSSTAPTCGSGSSTTGLPSVRGMLTTLTVGLQYLNGTFSANTRLYTAGTMIAFLPISWSSPLPGGRAAGTVQPPVVVATNATTAFVAAGSSLPQST